MRTHLWPVTLRGLTLAAGLLLLGPPPATAQQMQMMPPSQAELIRGLLPMVVNITSFVTDTSSTAAMNAASPPADRNAGHPKTVQGSGFVIDPSGVILTNNHVIEGAYDIQVMFSDGERVFGRVLATSHLIDLALVKVDVNRPLAAIRWADSDKVQIADPVFAIGNPLGVGLSVSSGIVSALNRNIMDTPYDDFIQTDAPINHGNSGGPLFNRSGEVIGIDTAIISPTTGSVGLGFAIPANDAQFVANRLLHDGHARAAYLGIKIQEVTTDIAAALGMSQPMGSIVSLVHQDGPAGVAGLQIGDVILRYDNITPSDERALLRAIARSTIGQAVPATVLRGGHEQTMRVTPVAWPEAATTSGIRPGQVSKPAMLVPQNLGLNLSSLSADRRAQYGLQTQQAGVLVDGVAAGTDAFDRGLAQGDVILRIQDTQVRSPQEVQAAVDVARTQHKAFILVLVLPKVRPVPGPRWIALRIPDGVDAGSQSARQ
jgi:serine protease Do